jgi:dTDP-4-dehydrorhamnose reductase
LADTHLTNSLELWGGHECTVNRVGDRWFDQTVRTEHERRPEDLDRFAAIGIKALRYPVLWERVSPTSPGKRNWRWSDERLNRIRELGMRPIAGLTHHGSGPRYSGIIEDSFAPGLAAHAAAVAERYPWIDTYTPVNEPLTTARFTTLYGHWHPHLRDETWWWIALFNQVDATRLSMRAIRAVNPHAKLIQTDDLGHTFSTPQLANQAEFENERRWLTWDLLAGRVTPGHYFWERLEWMGLTERARAIADDPCPTDMIGVNHYLTSERYLDHRFTRYPEHTHGGNYERRYADVEAVRVLEPGPMGLERLLETAWERYGVPVAITESHNGCTREEQMRWTYEAWVGAERLRARGVPVQAVTVWALLGGYDWDRLLTVENGGYECGSFDVRGGPATPHRHGSDAADAGDGRGPVVAGAEPARLVAPRCASQLPDGGCGLAGGGAFGSGRASRRVGTHPDHRPHGHAWTADRRGLRSPRPGPCRHGPTPAAAGERTVGGRGLGHDQALGGGQHGRLGACR